MTHMNFTKITAAAVLALTLASCASISKSECTAGNWADLGYRDGAQGKSRSVLADYVETCAEHGAQVARDSYLRSYETGLLTYCTYDSGLTSGENGDGFSSVCGATPGAHAFREGWESGHEEYEYRREYREFESQLNSKEDALADVTRRLRESELTDDERARLNRKKLRLRRDIEELEYQFRQFRRRG